MRYCAWSLLVALSTASCDRHSPPNGAPSSSASASPAPASAQPAPSERPAPGGRETPSPARLACRALVVKGQARQGQAPLTSGAAVSGSEWLELGPGARVALKHATSGRELTLEGPARALPCWRGEEEVLLARGRMESSAGPGARPGAEVAVFTPLGTVNFGDARIDIRASEGRVELLALAGEAWLAAAHGATRSGPDKIAGPKGQASFVGPAKPVALVEACEAAAERARGLAAATLGGSDAGSLGERAAAHLAARRAARAACGSARAAIELTANPEPLRQRLDRADETWKSLGGPVPPPAKSPDP